MSSLPLLVSAPRTGASPSAPAPSRKPRLLLSSAMIEISSGHYTSVGPGRGAVRTTARKPKLILADSMAIEKTLVRWLHVLFFLSGFPALLYQIVWQRALLSIYGVNIESVTVVVSAFMLGLGLGSLAGGYLSRRRAPLLVIFALMELSVALFGAISLHLFHWAASYTAGA